MSAKAIETHYKGYRFRSRLEARWAVFFDSLGVNWEYEVEGFSLPDKTMYLPDFKLHTTTLDGEPRVHFIEIKPDRDLTGDEVNKAYQLARAECVPVCIIAGDPYTIFAERNYKHFALFQPETGEIADPNMVLLLLLVGAFTEEDWKALEASDGKGIETEDGMNGFLHMVIGIARARKAAEKARAARFEHGEKG